MVKNVIFDNNGSIARLKSLAKPLTQSDIRHAVQEFLTLDKTINSYSESTTYDLIVDGEAYPPKAIFGLAMSKLLNIEVLSSHFSAGLKSPCFTTFENLGFEIRPKSKAPKDERVNKPTPLWTENELSETIDAYLDMFDKGKHGINFSKVAYYRALADKFGRSYKAYGRRMSNISYIMTLMDLPIVSGLAPLANVGPKHTPIIERLISHKLKRPFLSLGITEAEERSTIQSKTSPERPLGEHTPLSIETTTTVYKRSGKVKGWVIRRSQGFCELCGDQAPFIKEDGIPFLEVHHLTRMKDGGPDTVHNCVAVCPNCHRKLHYCPERSYLTQKLRKKILDIESKL